MPQELRTLEPQGVAHALPAERMVQGIVPPREPLSGFVRSPAISETRDARKVDEDRTTSRYLPGQGLADPAFAPEGTPAHVHVNQPYGSPITRSDPKTGAVTYIAPHPNDIALSKDLADDKDDE